MTEETPASRSDVDVQVSERQAFGAAFRKAADHDTRLDLVMSDTLRLPPHPDWTGDVTDWHADPFTDRNWQFQHHTLRWINPLRWAALEGDIAAGEKWRSIVRSWGESNLPPARRAGEFAWKDMADGNRAIELSLGAPLISDSDGWYVELLRAHVDWLLAPENLATKNHALHQHCGLFVAAATLRDTAAMDVAVERMTAQFESTFDEQGANDEGAVGYHLNNLSWWGQAWERVEAEGVGVPAFALDRLRRGRIALAHLTLPNAELPQIGDTKRQRVGRQHGPHVEYIVSRGRRGVPLEDLAIAYDRGYVISHSGWGTDRLLSDESHTIIRFGQDVKAHSHQDRGSVHLYTQGRPWLTDSGFHSYQNGDPVREHFLTRAAHNIASLPGREHDTRASVDLEGFEDRPGSHHALLRDRGYRDVELRRSVTYLLGPDCWIVHDRTPTPEKLVQRWHVDVGVEVTETDTPTRLKLQADGREIEMTWLEQPPELRIRPAQDDSMDGWISTAWKTVEPGTLVTAESGTANVALVIAPSVPERLEITGAEVQRDAVRITLARGERAWNVTIDGAAAEVTEQEAGTDDDSTKESTC